MTRIQLTCKCLMASAVVLTVLLIATLHGRFAPLTTPANAQMAADTPNYSFLIARTRNDGDSLFVLDKLSRRLVVYEPDISRNTLTPVIVQDLDPLFAPQRRQR